MYSATRASLLLMLAVAAVATYNWTPCTIFTSNTTTRAPPGTLVVGVVDTITCQVMSVCMALMDASAAGSFGSYNVSILFFDDYSLTSRGPIAATTFSEFPVVSVIGVDSSRVTMSMLNGDATHTGLTASGIPVISAQATSPLLSDKTKYPHFLRVCSSDALTSLAMIQMLSKYGITKIAGIANNDSYGQGGLEKLVTYAARAEPPIEVVSTIFYSPTVTKPKDLQMTLFDLEATGAEAYILYCTSLTCMPVLEQARVMGILEKPNTWILGDGITTDFNLQLVAEHYPALAEVITNKTNILGMATAVDSTALKDTFDTNFVKFLGAEEALNIYTYFEYDATLAWVYAVKKLVAAGKDPHNRSLLYSTLISLDYEGTTGDISFDENGDRFASIRIYAWVHGKNDLMIIGNWTIGGGVSIDPLYSPAQWRGTQVAAKVILTRKLKDIDEEKLLQEVAIMKALRHPNLLLFMCYVKTDTGLTIVTEFMPNGSLFDVLSEKALPLPLKLRLSILNDIAAGMAYLHGSNPPIIHCDLKSSNILAKVCDFGLTVIAQQHGSGSVTQSDDSVLGSLFWSAPEIIKSGSFSTKSDVYAFGVMVWEMVTRDLPYKDMNPRAEEGCNNIVPPPTGKMAIVFTDIQQSTELWEWNPSLMKEALYQHHDAMRAALRRHNGYEVKTEGDAFMIAFQAAIDALRFCVAAQRSLVLLKWNPTLLEFPACSSITNGDTVMFQGLRVRMGIHVGEPEVDKSHARDAMNSINSFNSAGSSIGTNIDFIGPCVNKASRVASSAKGGQIVLSSAAVEEIHQDRQALEQLGRIRDLGTVQLKGIAQPEDLYDFAIAGLERQFSDEIEMVSMNRDLAKPHVPEAALDLYERFSQSKSMPAWAISPSDIETIDEVKDKGSFGVVFKGVWRSQTVAVKKFFRQKVDSVTMTEIERQIKEIALLSEIRHPNVLLFMGACMEPHNMFIVTEWMDMGNLRQVISSSSQLEKQRGIAILTSICSALTYLHLCNIVHRDLKSSNILLSKRMDVKLSDFGLAAVKTANKTSTLCGTIAWMAPEVLSSATYSEASDVYSFGVVMNEILSCDLPFKVLNKVAIARDILLGKRPEIPKKLGAYSTEYVELFCKCWDQQPSQRPTFKAIGEQLAAL
eukprot:m51a1_g12408 putative serine threonine kinase (1142) ;mRNA; r:705131-710141